METQAQTGVQCVAVYGNSGIELQNGDMVEVLGPRPFPRHVGIYAARRGFIHSSKAAFVQLADGPTFSDGNPIRVLRRINGTGVEQEQAVQRAFSLIGTPYNLLNFNCEHAAYYALEGKARSPQLGFALVLLGLVGLWIIAES